MLAFSLAIGERERVSTSFIDKMFGKFLAYFRFVNRKPDESGRPYCDAVLSKA